MNRRWLLLTLSAALLSGCMGNSPGEESSAQSSVAEAVSSSQEESIAVPQTGQPAESVPESTVQEPTFSFAPRYLSVPDITFVGVPNPPAEAIGELAGVYRGTVPESKDDAAPGKGFLIINEDGTYTMLRYRTLVTGSYEDVVPLVVEEGVTTQKAGYYRSSDGQKQRLQGEILNGDPIAFASGYITQVDGQYALMPIDSYRFTPSINSEGRYVFNALHNPSPLIIDTQTTPTPLPVTLSENSLQVVMAPQTDQSYSFTLERGSASDVESVLHMSSVPSVQQTLDIIVHDMKERNSTGIPYPYYHDITEVPIYPMDQMQANPGSFVGLRPDNSSWAPEYAWYDYDNGVIFGYRDHQVMILEDGMWLTPVEKWGPEY